MGNSSQGVPTDYARPEDRHFRTQKEEGDLRERIGAVAERHRETVQELHLCGHHGSFLILLSI